jgi:hypothetical protein
MPYLSQRVMANDRVGTSNAISSEIEDVVTVQVFENTQLCCLALLED